MYETTENETQKMPIERAWDDMNRWFDRKKVTRATRDKQKESAEAIVEEIVAGNITIDDACNINYKLKFPIQDESGSDEITQLKFKPRITAEAVIMRMKNIGATEFEAKLLAYAAALTGNALPVLKKLDSEDVKICQSIAIFFL